MRADDVASDENALFARHLVVFIGIHQAPVIAVGFQAFQVTGLTNGGNDKIAFDIEFRTFDHLGLAAGIVEFGDTQGLGTTVVTLDHLDRGQATLDIDTFTQGIVDFMLGRVHVFDRLP